MTKKCPVCNSSKYAYSSITGIWFCRRCKFKNADRMKMTEKQWDEFRSNTYLRGRKLIKGLKTMKDDYGFEWYVDEDLKGTNAFIFDKGKKYNGT